jgi:hypothetical protein
MVIPFLTRANVWYDEMVPEWKKKCAQAKKDFEEDPEGLCWQERLEFYKPDLERWWCGCPSYQQSAYHLCKHLIRLYIGPDGLKSNKPPMPFYGQVWRQSVPPILWVADIHSEDQLVERHLRSNAVPPIRKGVVDELHVPREIDKEILPLVYDSDDEEEDDGEGNDRDMLVDGDACTGDDLGMDSEWEILPDDNNEDDSWDIIFGDA